jgi:hypothetical protein
MDRCEEDVIIACGLYLLSEEMRKNENTGFVTCSKQDKRKENFTHWTSEGWQANIFQIF